MDEQTQSKNQPGSRYALVVLFLLNMLVYVDRYVPSSTKELYKEDLKMSDAQTSYPLTVFIVVYMVFNPVFATLSDRGWERKKLIMFGVCVWSAATALGAFAVDYTTFLLARALVGVGEASYAAIVPTLLNDIFAPDNVTRAQMVFGTAVPIGAALGFLLGGVIGQEYGWRMAFLVCGVPGLVLVALVKNIQDPGRGVYDTLGEEDDNEEGQQLHDIPASTHLLAVQADDVAAEGLPPPVPWSQVLRRLWSSARFVVATAGSVALTFGVGGMADWIPTFLHRYHGYDTAQAGIIVGGITCVTGIAGAVLGSYLTDYARKNDKLKNPRITVPGLSMVPAALFVFTALYSQDRVVVVFFIFAAQLFIWFYTAPIPVAIKDAAPSDIQSRAYSVSTVLIHLLGDAISPALIGVIADSTDSLRTGLVLVSASLALSMCIWLVGGRFLTL